MTSNQQRAALQRQIWQIANNVSGAVDGWDFKQYVLGMLFTTVAASAHINESLNTNLAEIEGAEG